MSGVALITMTVGFFAIQELRASRAAALSEPAIGAAESAAEQGIWSSVRGSGVSSCQQGVNTLLLQGSRVWSTSCYFNADATLGIVAGTSTTLFLYDSNNINGNLNPGYGNLTVTHKTGTNAVTVRIERLDGSPVSTSSVSPGSQPANISLPSNPLDDNRFRVTLSSSGNITINVTTNQGMPDYPTLTAEGCMTRTTDPAACIQASDSLKRKINILLPR